MHRRPPIMSIVLVWLSYFERIVHSLLDTYLFRNLFFKPTLKHITGLGTPTLGAMVYGVVEEVAIWGLNLLCLIGRHDVLILLFFKLQITTDPSISGARNLVPTALGKWCNEARNLQSRESSILHPSLHKNEWDRIEVSFIHIYVRLSHEDQSGRSSFCLEKLIDRHHCRVLMISARGAKKSRRPWELHPPKLASYLPSYLAKPCLISIRVICKGKQLKPWV